MNWPPGWPPLPYAGHGHGPQAEPGLAAPPPPYFPTSVVLPATVGIDIASLGVSYLVFRPEVTFKPTALRIPHEQAHVLEVQAIHVGNRSLLLANGSMGAAAFCERRRGKMVLEMQWPTMAAGTEARVAIYNPRLTDVSLSGFMVGFS